jgi:hypothetical protein
VDRRLALKLAVCFIAPTLLSTRTAWGAPNDAAAQKLRDQAINQDYLATDFTAAQKKLNDAVAVCKKASDCSRAIRARVHCDLGVVEFSLHKLDLARTEFATALMEDPSVELDKDMASTDVRNEFAALKGGGPPPPATAANASPARATPSAARPGELSHAPPRRQQVETPLPLYVQVPAGSGAVKVVVRFKPVGASNWKTASMRKMADGYGGEIPCSDVGNSEGELRYYIQALDANGDVVAASGGSATPQGVAIVKKLDGDKPHLPGQPPPEACKPGPAPVEGNPPESTDASDCPPSFPGCHREGPVSCDSKDDCMAGEACVDQTCQREAEDAHRTHKQNWLSLAVQADALYMPASMNTCLGGNPPNGYTCFLAGTGNYYASVPAKNIDDQVISGFPQGAPMIRIAIGYDRAFSSNVTLGLRVGYAVSGGGPTRPANGSSSGGAAFMPLHVEARLAYFFGRNILARKGLRFFAFASGGMMEVDASQSVDVRPAGIPAPAVFLDAWTKTGLGFVSVGPGLMFAITPNSGPCLELRPTVLFPTFGFAASGLLGYTIGL